MDIVALGDGFGIGMMADFKYAWNKKDGTLSVSADKRKYPVHVTTNRGIFVEVVNESGDVIQEGGDGNWLYVKLGKHPVTLRYKTLPDPGLSRSVINKARQTVTRYLVDDMPYSAGVPDNLPKLIEWLKSKMAEMPAASRKGATCRFDTSMSYGETYPHVEVSYTEPETDEEVIRRVQIERERARLSDNAERAKLAALKAKFENAG